MSKRLRASVVCEAEGNLLLVRLCDPVSGVEALYPPGGGVEPAEAPAETARRETLEETGLRVLVRSEQVLVDTYPFCWAGVDYEVTTHYFAASLVDAFDPELPQVTDAPYHRGALWLPTGEALEALSVHPRIASAVTRLLRKAQRAGWEKHPNVAGPAATLLAVHDQFRAASERLLDLVGRESEDLAMLSRAFAPLAETLHHHHHAEEAMLFPLVLRQTGIPPEQLVSDHGDLTRAIAGVTDALRARGDRKYARESVALLDEVLISHLDREERLVLPVLLAMSPSEAWASLAP